MALDDDDDPNQSHGLGDQEHKLQLSGAQSSSSDGDQSGKGSHDEGRRHERRLFSVKLPKIMAAVNVGDVQLRADVVAAARAAPSVEALAPLLRRLVIGTTQPVSSNSGLALTVLQAAREWLASRTDDTVQPATLKSLREALMDSLGQTSAPGNERRAAAAVWLPVFLLNLDRPRTEGQREAAIARIDMLSRFLSKSNQKG